MIDASSGKTGLFFYSRHTARARYDDGGVVANIPVGWLVMCPNTVDLSKSPFLFCEKTVHTLIVLARYFTFFMTQDGFSYRSGDGVMTAAEKHQVEI